MDQLSVITWGFAVTGWILDWLSTVWPNNQFREKNPFVVRLFGPQPRPVPFGLAKVGSLLVIVGLSLVLDVLTAMEPGVPDSLYGFSLTLTLPVFVGVLGWYAFVHNLRLHLRTYQRT